MSEDMELQLVRKHEQARDCATGWLGAGPRVFTSRDGDLVIRGDLTMRAGRSIAVLF
jgi:hypothetical protein